jgi:elongation factor Ts
MFFSRNGTTRLLSRLYSTIHDPKPPLKLVAELRKLTNVPISKAREALSANNNDISASLEWLQKNLVTTGAKTVEKLENREARQGLISISVLSRGGGSQKLGEGGLRAAMVELACETDFVGRNPLFGKLAADIAHTAAFMSDLSGSDKLLTPCSLDMLNNAPLIPHLDPQSSHPSTIGNAIQDLTLKVGERVHLRRALTAVHRPFIHTQPHLGLRLASYLHGSVNIPFEGRIGVLAVLALKSPRLSSLLSSNSFCEDLERLERSLARQITGFDTRTIRAPAGTVDESALYDQPFMMLSGDASGQPVHTVLREWAQSRGLVEDEGTQGGVEVLAFEKWRVGDLSSGMQIHLSEEP